MADMEKSNEQMRVLGNVVHIAGILAEISYKNKGVNSRGVEFINFRGAVQCSLNDPAYTAPFSAYIPAKTMTGADSKLYKSAVQWLNSVIPMTEDKEKASLVDLTGSITSNNFVSSDGQFNETLVNNIKFFNEFKDYAYEMSIEGYIRNIVDEEDEEGKATGRKKVFLISNDMFRNVLKFEKDEVLIASKEIADMFDDADYDIGKTVVVNCARSRLETKAKPKPGGFGKPPIISNGKNRMVWEIIGGDPALDEDDKNAITSAQIKTMLIENNTRNEGIIARGYQGSSSESKPTGIAKKTGLGSKKNTAQHPVENEDDMPF